MRTGSQLFQLALPSRKKKKLLGWGEVTCHGLTQLIPNPDGIPIGRFTVTVPVLFVTVGSAGDLCRLSSQ